MKKGYLICLLIGVCSLINSNSYAQNTTAMNISQADCNGTPQDLFADLDAGQALILFYYMPNCGACIPPAEQLQAMANNINTMCPNFVKGYAFSYLNSTECAYTAGWVTGNNLPFYTPMNEGELSLAYYGGFGMPTVVVLAGINHDVLFVTQNYTSADTTTIRNLLFDISCVAGTQKLTETNSAISVFPNPTKSTVAVSINAVSNDVVTIDLIDVFGRTIRSVSNITILQGKTENTIDISNVPNGNYILRVQGNVVFSTNKLIIAD